VIPKAADNVANAETFLNFVLRPDISKQISDALPSLNPNLGARKLLSPAQFANPASYPDDKNVVRMQIFEDIDGQSSKIDEIVTHLKDQ
jgi:spermidine/putrescine transport system substrate-binding protein